MIEVLKESKNFRFRELFKSSHGGNYEVSINSTY